MVGHDTHEYTSGYAINSVFDFFETRQHLFPNEDLTDGIFDTLDFDYNVYEKKPEIEEKIESGEEEHGTAGVAPPSSVPQLSSPPKSSKQNPVPSPIMTSWITFGVVVVGLVVAGMVSKMRK